MGRALLGSAMIAVVMAAGGCSDSDGGGGASPEPDAGLAVDSAGSGAGTGGATPSGGSGGEPAGSGGTGGTAAAGTGGSQGGDGPSLQELPSMLVEAICVEVVDCLGAATVAQYFGDDSCADRFGAGIEDGTFSLIEAAVAEGRVTYNADQVEPCLASLVGIGCGFSTTRALEQDACGDVFVGSVAVGDACGVDEECMGEAFCAGDGCPGTCSALLGAGEPCDDDDQCESGLSCGDTCFAPAGEGDDCGGDVAPDCGEGLICAGDDTDTRQAGSCTTPEAVYVGALGESCDFDTLTLCEQGLSCTVSLDSLGTPSFECAEGVGSGEACSFGAPSQCPSGEYCDADISQQDVDGDCQPLPGAGEPCVMLAGAGTGCQAGLQCDVDDMCHAIQRLDGSCVSDDGCASGRCEGGVCMRPEACSP